MERTLPLHYTLPVLSLALEFLPSIFPIGLMEDIEDVPACAFLMTDLNSLVWGWSGGAVESALPSEYVSVTFNDACETIDFVIPGWCCTWARVAWLHHLTPPGSKIRFCQCISVTVTIRGPWTFWNVSILLMVIVSLFEHRVLTEAALVQGMNRLRVVVKVLVTFIRRIGSCIVTVWPVGTLYGMISEVWSVTVSMSLFCSSHTHQQHTHIVMLGETMSSFRGGMHDPESKATTVALIRVRIRA